MSFILWKRLMKMQHPSIMKAASLAKQGEFTVDFAVLLFLKSLLSLSFTVPESVSTSQAAVDSYH